MLRIFSKIEAYSQKVCQINFPRPTNIFEEIFKNFNNLKKVPEIQKSFIKISKNQWKFPNVKKFSNKIFQVRIIILKVYRVLKFFRDDSPDKNLDWNFFYFKA